MNTPRHTRFIETEAKNTNSSYETMFNVNIIDKDINHTKHINSIKFSQKYVENSPKRPECGEFGSDFYFVCTYCESGIILGTHWDNMYEFSFSHTFKTISH